MKLDATWQSYIHALPKGTMKFILNAAINIMPSKANLKLWGWSRSDKCDLCEWKQTFNCILSACPIALGQCRYTYCHKNISHELLAKITNINMEVFADIEGHTVNGGHNSTGHPCHCWEAAERLEVSRQHETIEYSSLVSIKAIRPLTNNITLKELTSAFSRVAVTSTYYIFINRNAKEWLSKW